MTLTVAPDFTDGVLTAAKLQQLTDAINERTPLRARLGSNHDLATSDTSLEDLTGVVVAVQANAIYEGQLEAVWSLATGTTEDIKFGFSFPAGATLDFGGVGPGNTLGAATGIGDGEFVRRLSATSASTTVPFGASTTITGGIILVTLQTSSTAGNFQAMAAQNTSGGNVVTVRAGTRLTLWRVA